MKKRRRILNVGNNSIVYNTEFNILARDSIYQKIDLNTNWIASDNPRFNGVCEKVKFPKYHMNVNQLDSNTLSVSVDGIKTDSLLKYSTNGGRNWQYATLAGGKATINVANADGNLMFDYYEGNSNFEYQMKDYVPCYVACGGTEINGIDFMLSQKIIRKFQSLNLGYIRDEIDGFIAYLNEDTTLFFSPLAYAIDKFGEKLEFTFPPS